MAKVVRQIKKMCLPIPNGFGGADIKFSSFLVCPIDARRGCGTPFISVLRSVTLSERVTFSESIEVSNLIICKGVGENIFIDLCEIYLIFEKCS